MGDAQFPVSLGGAGWDYGIGRGPSVFPPVEREGINLHRGYVQEEESESEEEGSSVFARVPEADSTPSPLFRGLVEETEDGGGGGGYCDDARFGSGACYGAIDSRNGELLGVMPLWWKIICTCFCCPRRIRSVFFEVIEEQGPRARMVIGSSVCSPSMNNDSSPCN